MDYLEEAIEDVQSARRELERELENCAGYEVGWTISGVLTKIARLHSWLRLLEGQRGGQVERR